MTDDQPRRELSRDLTRTVLAVLLLVILIGASFWVLRPFLLSIVWAAMIVVATWPRMLRVQARLRSRPLAVTIMSGAMVLVFVVLFLLLLFEPHPPLELAFEVVSAFSTTGLSTGVTPKLSTAGKLLITFTMFVGRIGPLTLALALARAAQARAVELPEERVMIG